MNRESVKNGRALIIVAALAVFLGAHAVTTPAGESMVAARAELAPTGKLRVAFPLPNALIVGKDAASGELRGMVIEVGRALAAHLGVPFEPVGYANIAKMMDSVNAGEWDIAMVAIDPARAKVFDFTSPFMAVDSTYLVPGNSSIMSSIDVDQPGVRVAVPVKSGQDLYFARHPFKHAELLRRVGAPATIALLKSGEADAFAENREVLLKFSKQLPGSRILKDRFDDLQMALAVPKGRPAGLDDTREFVRHAIASGQIQKWIRRVGLTGVRVVAP
ncbi:MAG: transporter substrate-binding domain-containing protein [Sulfuricaulis sp.]